MFSLTWIEAGTLRSVTSPSFPAIRSLWVAMQEHVPCRIWGKDGRLLVGA